MQRSVIWTALFSQTGSEICNLSERIRRFPDRIITDNMSTDSPIIDSRLVYQPNLQRRKYRGLSQEEKLSYLHEALKGSDIVTLHGWLNIIPPSICEEFNIYNGHPGLIDRYEELKGKDPQIRCFNNIEKYTRVGSVVHVVTAGVDEGEIKYISSAPASKCVDLDTTYKVLSDTSLRSWLEFFEQELRYTITR